MSVQNTTRSGRPIRPPASTPIPETEGVSAENLQSLAESSSKKELLIALLAVAITFASAVPIVLLRPSVTAWMRSEDRSLQHPREFLPAATGGTIRYTAKGGSPSAVVEEYRQDLALLERRFRRGQFQMVGIPGGETAAECQAMRQNQRDFDYRISTEGDAAVLTIDARTPQARAALIRYLAFLKERWTIGR